MALPAGAGPEDPDTVAVTGRPTRVGRTVAARPAANRRPADPVSVTAVRPDTGTLMTSGPEPDTGPAIQNDCSIPAATGWNDSVSPPCP